ncbi:hypothetical protein GGR54DRAFT_587790 [Hypoxylon sp. NC1633]|nr:hypothetical protein GGR54DRAFT_587790 [Hypoxylon sp. NC1633]
MPAKLFDGFGAYYSLSRFLHFKMRQDRLDYGELHLNPYLTTKHNVYSIAVDAIDTTGDKRTELSEIWSDALVFLSGGQSITTTIGGILFYLSRNTECYQKFFEEIRSIFNNSDEIRGGLMLSDCQYLRACVDEALRMAPRAPGT